MLEFLTGRRRLHNSELEGDVRLLLAEAHRLASNTDAALQELESAFSVFQKSQNTERLIESIVMAAQTAWDGRKVDDTRRWVEQGLSLARSSRKVEALVDLLSVGITVANLRGEFDQARELCRKRNGLNPL